MGGGSKSTTQTTNSTSQATPYAPAQGDINAMLQQAQAAYAATPKTPVFSGPNADQTSSLDYLKGIAPSLSTGAQQLQTLGTDMAAGKYLDPSTNPYISAAVAAANQPAQDAFGKNLVSIGDAATAAGAYGGDRAALMKATALGDLNTTMTNNAATMYANNYTNERALQMQAPSLLNAADQLMLQPAKVMSSVGDQEQSWQMAQVAAAQQAPWTGLDNWAQILGTVSPYATTTGSSSGTTTGPSQGAAGGALSGAIGGASAGAAFGPWGSAIGGVVGGLGGLFG